MNMKKMLLMLVALFSMTVAMAQNANGRQPRKMDATTVTTMMTQRLGLNADQQKKVEALNKKYESVLRPGFGGPRPEKGGTRPQMGQGSVQGKSAGQRPELTDEQKAEMKQRFEQRAAYEKELKGILSEDQYKTYQQMRPHHGMRGRHHGENCAQQQCTGDQQQKCTGNKQHCDADQQHCNDNNQHCDADQQHCDSNKQHCDSHVQQKDGEHCQQAKSNCCQSGSKVTDKTTEKTNK